MEQLKKAVDELKIELEDLISISNQSQGSSVLNLTVKLERLEDEVESRLDAFDDKIDEKLESIKDKLEKKEWQRWKMLGGAIVLAVTVFIGVIFFGANTLHERMGKVESNVVALQESNKGQVTLEKFIDLQRTSEKESALILEKLNHVVSINDFNAFKKEIYDSIIKFHLGDKNERPANSGK